VSERPKRATIKEIAERTGLSASAVSYALRGQHVSAETEARVREAADALGYRRDPIAQALRGGATGTIGLVVGTLADYWNLELVAALQRELRATERHLLIADAGGDATTETELARSLVDRRVDGLIVVPLGPMGTGWGEIAAATPTVSIGDELAIGGTAGALVFDNDRAVESMLRHLAGYGHQHISVLTFAQEGGEPDGAAERAVPAWSDRLGLACDLVVSPLRGDGAQPLVRELLAGPGAPTAVLALSDSLAFETYAATRDLRLRVPEDVSVAGYADHPLSRLVSPPLTSIDWRSDEIATAAVAALQRALDGHEAAEAVKVEPQLRARASTGPVPSRA